jgi:hypothetical protein
VRRHPYLAAAALALALVASCSLAQTARGSLTAATDPVSRVDRDERPQPAPVVSPSASEAIRHGLPQSQRLPILPALCIVFAPAALAPDDDVAALRPAGALEPRDFVRRVPTARYVPRPRSDEPG